jgi:Na+/alanine symporter
MPTINSTFFDGLLSTPLVLPAPVAGALAALFVVVVVMAIRRVARGNASRVAVPALAFVYTTGKSICRSSAPRSMNRS